MPLKDRYGSIDFTQEQLSGNCRIFNDIVYVDCNDNIGTNDASVIVNVAKGISSFETHLKEALFKK